MATEKFLHMRMTREDCDNLDALLNEVQRDMHGDRKFLHGGCLRRYTRSDVVKMAIAEALLKRQEENL